MIPLLPNEQFEYVLEAERDAPAEDRTVFLLRTLSSKVRALMEDEQGKLNARTGEMSMLIGTMKRKILFAGLAGWRNVCHPKTGNPIEFETESAKSNVWGMNVARPTDAIMDMIPPDAQTELANAITDVQRVTLEEGKD